jgi:Family of unknown function (DUF6221)
VSGLVEFLRARLDEDARCAAHATSFGRWQHRPGGDIVSPEGKYLFLIAARAQEWNGGHIARHDPARVLADVAAKRQIVEMYENAIHAQHAGSVSRYNEIQDGAAVDVLGEGLRLLALPYAEHPDYRQEWAP